MTLDDLRAKVRQIVGAALPCDSWCRERSDGPICQCKQHTRRLDVQARLDPILADLVRTGWRPIAEAPRERHSDGTQPWLLGANTDPKCRYFVRWNAHWMRWEDNHGNIVSPTHFQPLPPPPEATS